jgi:cellulose synthase/poly-beta-1,6-N-acetylglucosamine synthase-like glycosyltransferase
MLTPTEILVLTCYYSALVGLALYGSHRLMMVYLYHRHRRRAPQAPPMSGALPLVTVQLPIFNERYVVNRLIEAVLRIDYPRELLEVQVLDDSTDDTRDAVRAAVARYRAAGFRISHRHRVDRRGYKAGALAEGLEAAAGEFLLILDADFVPHPSILKESLRHFSNPRVGMVQSRWGHLNAEQSLLTRVESILLDGHFVIEHAARHRSGRFFNFNGTAGVWRRAAIEQAGGWSSDTLTEDLDLSYRAQLAGWEFVYLVDLVSPGELPVDVNSFKSQQHRWSKGAIQTGRKLLLEIFRSRFPLKVKIESFFHLTNNVSYPLVVALSLFVFPAMEIRHRLGWTRLIWLDFPLFLVSTASVLLFYLFSQKEIDGEWRSKIRYLPMLLSLGIGLAVNNAHAVLAAFLGDDMEFRRTPKYAAAGIAGRARSASYRIRVPRTFLIELALAVYLAAAIVVSIRQRMYLALPFLMVFFNGYVFIAALTLADLLPSRRRGPGPAQIQPRAIRQR